MADFIPNTALSNGDWTDVTGAFATKTVAVQNVSATPIRVYFGPTAPVTLDEGIVLPPYNWPPLAGVVLSSLWAYGIGAVHVSERD